MVLGAVGRSRPREGGVGAPPEAIKAGRAQQPARPLCCHPTAWHREYGDRWGGCWGRRGPPGDGDGGGVCGMRRCHLGGCVGILGVILGDLSYGGNGSAGGGSATMEWVLCGGRVFLWGCLWKGFPLRGRGLLWGGVPLGDVPFGGGPFLGGGVPLGGGPFWWTSLFGGECPLWGGSLLGVSLWASCPFWRGFILGDVPFWGRSLLEGPFWGGVLFGECPFWRGSLLGRSSLGGSSSGDVPLGVVPFGGDPFRVCSRWGGIHLLGDLRGLPLWGGETAHNHRAASGRL